jgi:hypothetical protein
MHRFHSLSQLDDQMPDAKVDTSSPVDFNREDLVQVKWEGHLHAGHPWGWTARAGGRYLAFHEQTPSWGAASDCFCRALLEKWFAVPKGSSITVGQPAHFMRLDATVLGGFVIMGIGVLSLTGKLAARRNRCPG